MLKLIRFGLATACVAFGLQAATIPEILQEVDGKWELMASRILPVDGKVAQALAAKYTCLTCHNPDTKLVGPAYRDIAARYQDDGEAMAKVLGQIEKGGTGRWGTVSMPPLGDKVPAADSKTLGEWILFYRWDAILAD